MGTWQLLRCIWTDGFAARHLSMVNECQQPQDTLELGIYDMKNVAFKRAIGDSASLIETSGFDLNFTRATIYRDVAT